MAEPEIEASDSRKDQIIEVRATDLRRLFLAIDPSPLKDRDLDPGVEEFIVEWSREVHPDTRLCLAIELDATPTMDEAARVREAIHRYFAGRAQSARLRLRRLFRVGRTSLLIGLLVLGGLTSVAQLIGAGSGGIASVLREGLYIGGWVAMWRPLEIFLYDWWPIRADRKLFDRLAVAPIHFAERGTSGAVTRPDPAAPRAAPPRPASGGHRAPSSPS